MSTNFMNRFSSVVLALSVGIMVVYALSFVVAAMIVL
jgi:hypothetical protein